MPERMIAQTPCRDGGVVGQTPPRRVRIGASVRLLLMSGVVSVSFMTTQAPAVSPDGGPPTPPGKSLAATDTPAPADVVRLSGSPDLMAAALKPPRKTSFPGHVVFTLPKTSDVLLASELTYYEALKLDIYYPPRYDFSSTLPVVILAHGFQEADEHDKDMPSHVDWAKLIAASGMIAVSAQAGSAPVESSYHALDYLAANAGFLGLDLSRIGFWACSGQGEPVFKALEDQILPYREAFKAALLIYPDVKAADPGLWPKGLSLFVIRAGEDRAVPGPAIDRLVERARSSGIATEYVELAGAPHGFDVLQNTQTSKDAVKRALEFLKAGLLARR